MQKLQCIFQAFNKNPIILSAKHCQKFWVLCVCVRVCVRVCVCVENRFYLAIVNFLGGNRQ